MFFFVEVTQPRQPSLHRCSPFPLPHHSATACVVPREAASGASSAARGERRIASKYVAKTSAMRVPTPPPPPPPFSSSTLSWVPVLSASDSPPCAVTSRPLASVPLPAAAPLAAAAAAPVALNSAAQAVKLLTTARISANASSHVPFSSITCCCGCGCGCCG